MNTKKLLLGTLVGFVAMFLAGWGIWDLLVEPMTAGYYTEYTGLKKEMPNVGLIAASCLAASFLMTYIFVRWAGIKTFMSGAKAGALIAVLMGLTSSSMLLATLNYFSFQVLLADAFANIFWGGIAGGAIGWILGRGNNDA